MAAAAIVLLLAVLQKDQLRAVLTGVPEAKHIAVLPFVAIGSSVDKQAFADGLTETVTSNLSALDRFQKALWVVPSSEVRARKLTSVEETRKAFGVTLVITGNVQPHGDVITVTANLVDARNLKQLQSRTIEISTNSAASLQNSVVDDVAGMLGIRVGSQARRALSAGQAENPEAYRLYELGLGYVRRYGQENVQRAIQLFQEAVSKDARFALGYTQLSEAYLLNYAFSKNAADIDLATLNIRQALQLNDKLAAAHATLAGIQAQTGQLAEAIAEFHRALEMDPADGIALVRLAQAYAAVGNFGDAEATFQRAIEIRPDYWLGYLAKGNFYFGQSQYSKAEKMYRAVVELIPDSALGYHNLGGVYLHMANYTEAERVLLKAIQLHPNAIAYSNLSVSYSYRGRWREAVDVLLKAVDLDPNNDLTWRNLGDAYSQLPNLAFRAPEAYRMALQAVTRQLKVNPNSPGLLINCALYAAKLKDLAAARASLKKAYASRPLTPSLKFKVAIVWEIIGDRDRALTTLSEAVGQGFSSEQVSKEPELAALRKDPRFQALVARNFIPKQVDARKN